MISLLKFEYIPALIHISANVKDQGFDKAELEEIRRYALRIEAAAQRSLLKLNKKTKGA